MNKKWIHQGENLFHILDKNKFWIILANIILWFYYLFGLLGIALISLILLLIWIAGKWFFRIKKETIKTDRKIFFLFKKLLTKKKSAIKNNKRFFSPNCFRRLYTIIKQVIFCLKVNKNSFKIGYFIITHAFLILFFLGILFYNNGIIQESSLRNMGIISAILYFNLHIFNINEAGKIKTFITKCINHLAIKKIKAIFKAYLEAINILNIYIFPWIALTIFIFFLYEEIYLETLKNLLLLYIFSLSILIVNSYTLREQKAFLLLSGKMGAFIKTGFYFFIPGYLIFELILGLKMEDPIYVLMGLLIGLGSIWIAHTDYLYRHIGLPTIKQSGKAFVITYLKTFFKYGLIFFIIFLTYLGAYYTRNNNDSLKVAEAGDITKFNDLSAENQIYPAINHLVESGAIKADGNNFIHPARLIDIEEMFTIFFNYFGISISDYSAKKEIVFTNLSRSDARYPLFKTAYHLGLIQKNFSTKEIANKRLALKTIGVINDWGNEKDSLNKGLELDIISNNDLESLDLAIDRSTLAQMIYNIYLNDKK